MPQRYFKFILTAMLGISLFSIFKGLLGPSSDSRPANNYNVQVTQAIAAGNGLNLAAVGELLKKASTAEEFERLLNSKDNGVNNLDLNGDGSVDYIKVTEFSEGNVKGFSLTTEPGPGEVQEVATIKIEKAADGEAVVETQGNPQLYGNNHYYQSSWSGIGTGLMMGYLFGAHRPWSSPYSYGSYPAGYQSYSPVSRDAYRSRHAGTIPQGAYTRTTGGRYDHIKSPNHGKSSALVKSPLKNSARSQKGFRARSTGKNINKRGFGRKSAVKPVRKSFSTGRRSRGFGRRR